MSQLKQKIASIAKNKEAKTVAGNFVWLSALQVAGYIFPLITLPYLSRVIGVEGFGKIAFAAAVMVWIQTIADWGFNLTATRDVAQHRDNKEKVSEIFSNVLWARCLLMLLSFIVLSFLVIVVPKFREEWLVIMVTFLMIPGHIFFPDWFFQGMEKMKYTTILNVVMKLFFTIMIFIFVKQPEDYILQPLFTSLGYVFSGLIALYIILGKWGISIKRPNKKNILQTIKGSTDVFINNLAPNLYNSLSVVLLGFFGGGTANGIYEGGNKFVSIISNFTNVISRAFYPFLSRRPDKHSLYVKLTIPIITIVSVVLYITAPWMVKVMLSPEFHNSIIVIRILAVSLVFNAISTAYGACYLVVQNRTKILRQLTLICSIVGFLIAIPLVYYYTYVGVALAVTISRALLGFTSYLAAKSNKTELWNTK